MATLYVLNVPEFSELLGAVTRGSARAEAVGDYLCVTSDGGQLVLERARVGARDAVWFSALTGGYSGTLARFDESEIRLMG